MAVYGPTMKINKKTNNERREQEAAEHCPPPICGRREAVARAIIHASGVVTTSRTARVTAPDVTETTRGPSAPGALRELTMALPDKCVARAMTGPSKATQITPAPTRATTPATEWMAQGAPLGRPRPGRSGSRPRSAARPGDAAGRYRLVRCPAHS